MYFYIEFLKSFDSYPKAAPVDCFCQRSIHPANEFQIGHKLETNDPRNPSSVCIASVIGRHGCRIRLRLDWSDDRNDFWRMCDSDQLHPFEYSAKQGVKIQPPMGFLHDLSKFSVLLEKMIQLAGQGVFTFAPEKVFKDPPVPPLTNLFRVGHKLEAVEQQYPYLIYPATVKDIKGNQLLISFIGFNQHGEFWCSYTSRDLFPIGW